MKLMAYRSLMLLFNCTLAIISSLFQDWDIHVSDFGISVMLCGRWIAAPDVVLWFSMALSPGKFLLCSMS